MKISYERGPWPDTEPDAQPGIRAELEALGFALLGGCFIVGPGRDEILRIADSYLPEMRPQAREWLDRPGQVFGSPDRSAFVKVVWFFGCPYAEFSTVLHDGRLVQTEVAWGADPWWPAGRQRAVALLQAAQQSRMKYSSRAQLAASWVLAVPVLLVFAVLVLSWDPDLSTTLFLIVLLVSINMRVARSLWLRTRHWRWLRPRFRAPVPQSVSGQR